MKRVTITFDYEGTWGMPFTAPYDLAATTGRLLEVLDQHSAKAVFFVTAKLVEEHPDTIRTIHERGHEIGFHGYTHEHMHALTDTARRQLTANLIESAGVLEAITGYRPRGFRAPYLMGPKFYEPGVYGALAEAGFTWVSNREIRWPEELFRPDRLRYGMGLLKFRPLHSLLLVALNPRLILTERPHGGRPIISAWRWLLGRREPFRRPEGLLEYPLTSPLDCDLVGFPRPSTLSGAAVASYAASVINRHFELSADYFNINCHDWITGTTDRLAILDQTLAHIATHADATYYLPGRPETAK